MKTLIVFDSMYGHTQEIARAIGAALPGEVKVVHASEAATPISQDVDLLVAGAPTHGANPSEAMRAFLDKIQAGALQGIHVAGFDTRMTNRLITIFGTAAPKIAKALESKGGTLVGKPGGFLVTGGKGPLKEGELERAAAWAKELVAGMS